jgi:hypothetical protein
MVLLTDVYRNVTSLRVNRLRIFYKFLKKQSIKFEFIVFRARERGFKQFKCPVRNVLRWLHRTVNVLSTAVPSTIVTYSVTFDALTGKQLQVAPFSFQGLAPLCLPPAMHSLM